VPLALQYVLERMMQKAPAARWAGADAVAAQLARQQPPPADFARWRRHHAARVRDARRGPRRSLVRMPAALVRTAADTLGLSRADAHSATERVEIRAGARGAAPSPEQSAPDWASSGRVHSRTRLAVLGTTLLAGLGTTLAVRAESAGVETALPDRVRSAPVGRARPRIVSSSRGDVASAARTRASATAGGPTAATRPAARAPTPERVRPRPSTPRAAPDGPGPRTAALGDPAMAAAPGAAPATRAASAEPAGLLARLAARVRGALPLGGADDRATAAARAELERPVHPPALLGAWAHGDRRSRHGDSLLLELRADGSARGSERRYAVDGAKGWRAVRVERVGRWEMRYGTFGGATLCVLWRSAGRESCESAVVDESAVGPVLTYGGRHWRPRSRVR
jgi:hypothetical protein